MELGYEEFVGKLRLALVNTLGVSEGTIRFEEEENQMLVECGADDDKKEVCGFYTVDLYERYQNDVTIEEIAEMLIEQIKRVSSPDFMEFVRRIGDYEKARPYLFVRLLNFKKNKERLRKAVYCAEGDIAMVLYMKVYEDGEIINSTKVLKQYVTEWGKTIREVFEDAIYNTYRMTPPRIYRWQQLLCNPEYEGEEFMEQESDAVQREDVRGNCLSTTRKTNGAIAIFLPGVAKRLSDMIGADLYLAFTSIHEVMVHNAEKVSKEDLEEVLTETIREATPEEDYLSSRIYHFSRVTGKFTCL